MISERVGDLLTETDLTHIAHQANLEHVMGGGIAAQIRKRFPYAAAADRRTPRSDKKKLGTYSVGYGNYTEPAVVNLYSQRGLGGGDQTDYPALRKALTSLEKHLNAVARDVKIGVPYRLGCGVAGGSWPQVYGILEAVFGKSPVALVIVKLPTEVA